LIIQFNFFSVLERDEGVEFELHSKLIDVRKIFHWNSRKALERKHFRVLSSLHLSVQQPVTMLFPLWMSRSPSIFREDTHSVLVQVSLYLPKLS